MIKISNTINVVIRPTKDFIFRHLARRLEKLPTPALGCISTFSSCPSKKSLSLLYKAFLRPLLTYASPGWFLFLSITNTTKIERLHRAASRAITGCLSFSPIPLFSEASLLPLRVTLTHFALSCYGTL